MKKRARGSTVCTAWLGAHWRWLLGSLGVLGVGVGAVCSPVWPQGVPRWVQALHLGAPLQALTPMALTQVAAQAMVQGDITPAEDSYRRALAQHPANLTLQLQRAHLYAVQRQFTEAEAAYAQAEALEARAMFPQRAPGDAQHVPAALGAYRQAVIFARLAHGAEAQRAELWLYHQQFEAVAQYAGTLMQQRDGVGAGYTLQGRLALARRHVPEALTFFQRALSEAPDFAPAYYGLGLAYLQQDHVQLATHAWDTALTLAPEGVELARALAHLYMQTRAFVQALAVGERVRTVSPHHPGAYRIIGHAWLALGEPARGLAALRTVTAEAPHDPRSHYELGLGYRQDHQENEARRAFEHALALNPYALEALTQLVDMALVKGEIAQARERVLRHVQVVPHAPQVYTLLGSILFAEDERCRGNNNVHVVRKRQNV